MYRSIDLSTLNVVPIDVPDGAERPGDPSQFRVTRVDDDGYRHEQTVTYTVRGTATPGADKDYTPLSGTVTFEEGRDHAFVPVLWQDDDEIEADQETVTLALPAGPQAEVRGKDDDLFIVLISGHTQNGGNDKDGDGPNATNANQPSLGAGIRKLESMLHGQGFTNTQSFSEDPGNMTAPPVFKETNLHQCGDNLPTIVASIKAKISALPAGATLKLALIGYSHGGGLAKLVAAALDEEGSDTKGKYSLVFSAYIDAIVQPSRALENPNQVPKWPMPPETGRPLGSAYHSNHYQSVEKYFPEPLGGSVTGSTPDVNYDIDTRVIFTSKDRMSHYQIEKDQRVHWDIIKHLKIALGR